MALPPIDSTTARSSTGPSSNGPIMPGLPSGLHPDDQRKLRYPEPGRGRKWQDVGVELTPVAHRPRPYSTVRITM